MRGRTKLLVPMTGSSEEEWKGSPTGTLEKIIVQGEEEEFGKALAALGTQVDITSPQRKGNVSWRAG